LVWVLEDKGKGGTVATVKLEAALPLGKTWGKPHSKDYS
jgi:hypothetical protein